MTVADWRDVVIAGPRVRIRGFTRDDVDAWQAWPDYDETLIAGTSPRRLTAEQRTRWYEDIVERQRQIPFAVDDETGFLIGRLFLRNVQIREGSGVLGIDLHPDFLGRAYGTESLRIFLPHFFDVLEFRKMLLSVASYNERARRCYLSLGFLPIGSHWDAQPGRDISRAPEYEPVKHLFRRTVLGLETLYEDMALERERWHQLDTDGRRHDGPTDL